MGLSRIFRCADTVWAGVRDDKYWEDIPGTTPEDREYMSAVRDKVQELIQDFLSLYEVDQLLINQNRKRIKSISDLAGEAAGLSTKGGTPDYTMVDEEIKKFLLGIDLSDKYDELFEMVHGGVTSVSRPSARTFQVG